MKLEVRVGLLVLSALVILAGGIIFIGGENSLFVRKNDYFVRFPSVSGLSKGSPVELDGVKVGSVQRIVLPRDPARAEIEVWLQLDSSYSERLRSPQAAGAGVAPRATLARIQTIGLLGDKFLELNSGALQYPVIPPDSMIPSAPTSNVDALLASGEDVMTNVVRISHSLSAILDRTERGEGVLGELTSDSAAGRQLEQEAMATMQSLRRSAEKIESGPGVLPRLVNDRRLADRLAGAVDRLDALLASAQSGEGALPALLNDPATRAKLDGILTSLDSAASDIRSFTAELDKGHGLLPRLVNDDAWGGEMAVRLRDIVDRLSSVADKLDGGQGTAGRLINDPQIYDALNDVVVGVNKSRLLHWLIQNRQKAGIKQRYEDATRGSQPGGSPNPAPPPPV